MHVETVDTLQDIIMQLISAPPC